MNVAAELTEFITSEVIRDAAPGGLTVDEPLMSSGRVDSMGILQIVAFAESRYEVDILATGSPQDFETIGSLAAVIDAALAGP